MEHVIKGYHDEALKQGYSLPPEFKNFIFGLLAQDREERKPMTEDQCSEGILNALKKGPGPLQQEHPDPLAAKLERLAEHILHTKKLMWRFAPENGSLEFLPFDEETYPSDGFEKGWRNAPLAAVEQALKEIENDS